MHHHSRSLADSPAPTGSKHTRSTSGRCEAKLETMSGRIIVGGRLLSVMQTLRWGNGNAAGVRSMNINTTTPTLSRNSNNNTRGPANPFRKTRRSRKTPSSHYSADDGRTLSPIITWSITAPQTSATIRELIPDTQKQERDMHRGIGLIKEIEESRQQPGAKPTRKGWRHRRKRLTTNHSTQQICAAATSPTRLPIRETGLRHTCLLRTERVRYDEHRAAERYHHRGRRRRAYRQLQGRQEIKIRRTRQ
jgi:hypothetical protein